ncbi:hypothetical protein GW17_00022479 [Ensete ventricosum]|nr:hypothetical protein GW17_00022479 [Ensete ventricosum]RZR81620.1 hypothetical protein BHM03_00007887 [Ensete ventricosum]
MDCPRAMLHPGVMCGRRAAGELDCSSAYIRLREPGKSEDKTEGVEVGGRKGRRSDKESRGAQLPKSKASARIKVDAGVLDQGKKYTVCSVVPFLLKGVGDKDDGEDSTILRATKTIKGLLQVGVKFCSFQAKLLAFQKFDGNEKANHSS